VNATINDSINIQLTVDNGTSSLSLDSTFVLLHNDFLSLKFMDGVIVSTATPIGKYNGRLAYPYPKITINNYSFSKKESVVVRNLTPWLFRYKKAVGIIPMRTLSTKRYLSINLLEEYITPTDSIDERRNHIRYIPV